MTTRLITASVAASEDSAVAYVPTPRREKGTAMFSVVLSSTGNVLLQGRMHGDDAWHTITTYTATSIAAVNLFPHMRTSMNTNIGTVSAWLDV